MININIPGITRRFYKNVSSEAKQRAVRGSNYLRNAELEVLSGQRSGRRYRVPYTGTNRRKPKYYTASAPGEAPAQRTGTFRRSWSIAPRAHRVGREIVVSPAIISRVRAGKYLLAEILEDGHRMAPRSFVERIKDRAYPHIHRLYSTPYKVN